MVLGARLACSVVVLALACVSACSAEDDAADAGLDAGHQGAKLDGGSKPDDGGADGSVEASVDTGIAPKGPFTAEPVALLADVTALILTPLGIFVSERDHSQPGNLQRQIRRVHPATGEITLLAVLERDAGDVIVEGDRVIWSEDMTTCGYECEATYRIRSVSVNGGPITDIVPKLPGVVTALAVADGALWFVRRFELERLDLTTNVISDVTPNGDAVTDLVSGDITATPQRLYFTLDGELTAYDFDSEGLVPLGVSPPDAPSRLEAHEGFLYFMVNTGISRLADGASVIENIYDGPVSLHDFDVGNHVFWTEAQDCEFGRVARVGLAGEGPSTWSKLCWPVRIAVGESHVYFVDATLPVTNVLYRAPLD
jgi:hypothetical protein